MHASTLINYRGKLGALLPEGSDFITRAIRRFEMWVLEDPEKTQMVKAYLRSMLYFVGVTTS